MSATIPGLDMPLTTLVDRYQKLRADRDGRQRAFAEGRRPYLIFHTPPASIWGDIRTPEACFAANIQYVARCLDTASDDLPALEPWFGTGVYANMFGCPYVWREDNAPAVHYRYHTLDEVAGLPKPRWADSEIARLVLDTIRYFKARTGDAIPIVWTDTQSASDTATLVLDACEVLAGCITEPQAVLKFMGTINELVIEFSQVQAELIGDAIVHPGHIMLNGAGLRGMSISDDNLAVASPDVNRRINLPMNDQIGQAMGGVAIHSCGCFSHSMAMVPEVCPSCVAIDCALDGRIDPNPNEPEAVRDALAGTGIALHARMAGGLDDVIARVKRLLHPDLRLIVHAGFADAPDSHRRYEALDTLLAEYYA